MFLTKQSVVNTIKATILESFGEKSSNINKVINLQREIAKLNEQAEVLKEELADLKIEHKKEKTEIEFLLVMKEKKQTLDGEINAVAVEKEISKKELQLQKEYFDKTETLNKEHLGKMEKLTDTILRRLPDVNMHINKGYKPDGE